MHGTDVNAQAGHGSFPCGTTTPRQGGSISGCVSFPNQPFPDVPPFVGYAAEQATELVRTLHRDTDVFAPDFLDQRALHALAVADRSQTCGLAIRCLHLVFGELVNEFVKALPG